MEDDIAACQDKAESLRKMFRYRQLILSGRLVLPHRRAAQLLGPDCLYHLYSLKELDLSHGRGSRSRPGKRTASTPQK
jgi:hypothetical protein